MDENEIVFMCVMHFFRLTSLSEEVPARRRYIKL
jgi:hypothetical protein